MRCTYEPPYSVAKLQPVLPITLLPCLFPLLLVSMATNRTNDMDATLHLTSSATFFRCMFVLLQALMAVHKIDIQEDLNIHCLLHS